MTMKEFPTRESLIKLFKEHEQFFSTFTSLEAFEKSGEDQQRAEALTAKATDEGYRVVVSVIEASNCLAEYKKGDRLVFNMDGQSIPEESTTSRTCVYLMSPLLTTFFYNEALMANGIFPHSLYHQDVDCADPGPGEKGGFGHVKAKVEIVKTK